MTEATASNETEIAHVVIEHIRVLVVAGIAVGAILVGVGSRLAMFVLRITSPDSVRGVTSDDGFIIGRVTLGGTYNLLLLGAAVGVIGAGAYRLVAPWLIGPGWFRRFTTGAASAAVAGSMLVHADGVDFTLLKPTWLAIGLFVALPGLFGVVIGMVVDRVAQPDSWTANGRRRWALPVLLVICFPLTLPFIGVAAAVVLAFAAAQRSTPLQHLRATLGYGLVVRSIWLLIAFAGLAAVINDARAIA